MAGKQDAALVVTLEFTTAGSVVKAVGELLASRQVRVPSGGVLVLKIDEKPSGFDDSKNFTWSLVYKVGWCCRRWKRKLLVFDCGAGTCLWHFRQIGVSSFWSVFFVNPKYAHTLDENAFCGGYSLVGLDGVSVSSNSDDIARVCHVM